MRKVTNQTPQQQGWLAVSRSMLDYLERSERNDEFADELEPSLWTNLWSRETGIAGAVVWIRMCWEPASEVPIIVVLHGDKGWWFGGPYAALDIDGNLLGSSAKPPPEALIAQGRQYVTLNRQLIARHCRDEIDSLDLVKQLRSLALDR